MMNESNNNDNSNDNSKDTTNDVNCDQGKPPPPPPPKTSTSNINSSNDLSSTDPSPLITVDGELSDFLLHGHLGNQINSDLARESINWQRISYDANPLPVYVEAHFVRLDPNKHLLLDFFTKDNVWLMNSSGGVDGGKRTLVSSITDSPSRFRTLHTSPLKRHHSFNSGGSIQQQRSFGAPSNWSHNKLSSSSGRSSIESSIASSSSSPTEQQQRQTKLNFPRLFRLIGKRYCLNNGARALLNSYWLESNHDLESYNKQIRNDLLNWFQKILTLTACYNQVGLNQDFSMDFFVVIVVRNHLTSIGSMSHMMNSQFQQQKAINNNQNKSSGEQLLNFSNLVSGNNQNITSKISSRNNFNNNNNNKQKKTTTSNVKTNTKTSLQRQAAQPLSSSMSSLNTAVGSATNNSITATYLTHQQLVDQIRNDLLVCFQLFRQNHLANGTSDPTIIPADNSVIAAQLLERIIIFDSTSNASPNSNSNSNNSNISVLSSNSFNNNNLPPTNPIISSTARTFSALSNFSTSSIKINPSSMMSSMSPTRNISRTKATNILSGTTPGPSSSSVPNTTILNYSQFIMRIRHFLLEFYTKQFDCYEKLIKQIRELRIDPQWDYFGFFLLQEELAFAYESLGLYGKALMQYDELDELFSQLVSNVSHHGGFGAPMWMKKRLMFSLDDDDDNPMDFDDDLNELKSLKPTKSNNNYHGWTGLCLCNQKSIMNLRMSILRSVLVDDCDDSNEHSTTESSSSRTMESDHPLSMNKKNSTINQYISLLDFRNYLYARQCHLLCLLNKPWELASRALSFLQTSVAELNMLEISMPPGGVACWVFLSVLEILHKCERYSDSSQLNSYSYHTVGLWSYARDNLIELGKICNLMPEFNDGSGDVSKPLDASEHLHRMVELVAGMGADPHVRPFSLTGNTDHWMSPQERLKDALSSADCFLHHYLEITELTMGTYKHIGHIRRARSIGKQLAELYLKLNKPQQALPFLLDLYHLFHIEHWALLKKETCQLLAKCLEQLYFNTSNTLFLPNQNQSSSSSSSNSGFSLPLIIRSACRAYLLLLLLPSTMNSECKERDQYIEAMIRMVGDFSKRSTKIKQDLKIESSSREECSGGEDFSMLVIHNSYFDLLHDGLATVARSNASSVSPCGSNSNSSSHSNLPIIESNDGQAVCSNQSNQQGSDSISIKQSGSKTSSNEHINQQQKLHYLSNDQLYPTNDQCVICANVQNNQQPDFIVMENIEIQCDHSPIANRSTDVPSLLADLAGSNRMKDGQSFIAGSVLKLKLKIQSKVDLKLKLDKIQITIRFHQDDPESSTMIKTKLSNDPEHQTLSNESGGRKNIHHYHHHNQYDSCLDLPKAKMEACYSSVHKSAGIKCLNENDLLKRTDVGVVGGYHNRPFDGGGHYKFMSQSVPISLLNQRLSQDDHQRYYRFQSMPLKFESNNMVQLEMLAGSNEYELQCKTKEDLFTIAKQFNLIAESKQQQQQRFSINNVNHLWFSLDQLILFCHYDHSNQRRSTSSMKFVIVEDFGHRIPHNNSNDRNAFRLVKCPPSIELVPFNQQYNACFIGIPHLMCLHLNSGTSRLPEGLKCSIEISRLLDKNRSTSIYEMPQDPINVSLHRVDQSDQNEEMVSFCLEHPLEPFETYRLIVLLRSSYIKPNKLRIKGVNKSHQMSWSVAPKPLEAVDQHDFKLSLSWNWTEHHVLNGDDDSKQIQITGCQFTLFDAFHLQPKLCTAGPDLKFFQIQIFASKRLSNDLALYFCHPVMKETNKGNRDTSHYSSPFVPVYIEENGENLFNYRLISGNQLNFIWSINVETADLNEVSFHLKFKPKLDDGEAEDSNQWSQTVTEVNVSYQVFVLYEWRTRYVIRQWIEPLIKHVGAKNSEIIRVGHSCLLHLRIERYFGNTENDQQLPPQPDEFIMYELICDPQLWSLISTWNPISTTQLNNDPNEDGTNENGSNVIRRPSNEEMAQADTTPKPVKFSGSKMVVDVPTQKEEDQTKMTNDSGGTSFQAAFQVMPLMAGYLPLPKVRLSLYRMSETVDGQDDTGVTMLKSNRSNSDSNCNETQSKNNTNANNTIESLSAMLSENLSLSGKNWSKYLSPNARNNPIQTDGQQSSSASSTSLNLAVLSAKNVRLEPFEAGQVYNYNRASQIYVSPSNITAATTDSWFN